MKGNFWENRRKIQKAFCNAEVVETLEDTEYTIEEEKTIRPEELKLLHISEIPYSSGFPNVWVLKPEEKNSLFSLPECFKRVERVLVVYSSNSLYILMVEMKTAIGVSQEANLNAIQKKILDTAGWVSKLLTMFLHDFEDMEIHYVGIVAYNKAEFDSNKDKETANTDMGRIFEGKTKFFSNRDCLGIERRVWVKFMKNPNPLSNSMDLDLTLAMEDFEDFCMDFQYAKETDKTCPCL